MYSIFSPKDFDKEKLRNFMQGINDLEGKKNIIRKWQKDIESKKVDQLGETQQDIPFVTDIFEKVLDYEHQNSEKWNITIKPKTDLDATKPDAVLGYFDVNGKKIVRTVIELKKTTIDLDRSLMHKGKDEKTIKTPSPVSQAFSYVPKFSGNCRWVIVSNFKEIRLYHASNSTKYEVFEVESLLEPENFAKFLFLMHKSRLFGQGEGNDESFTDILYAEKRAAEERITIEFYNGYQDKREILFHSLCKTNPEKDKLAILSATQKLIDRLIFICFTRDVIPMPNVLLDIKQAAERIYFEQDNFFWELLNKTFKSYNKGFADRIPLFNGGLFSENEFLNTLIVKDFQLLPLIEFLLKYDFQSELNVTILGHIFEQSIADLEILKDEITKNQDANLKPAPQNQRKTDGVFYTPDYITQYIIKNSVGTWLEEQKEILLEKHKSENIAFWEDYKIVLQNIKILDPACGSGAFLVEVFNFLLMEWQILLNELQKTTTKTKKVAKKQGGLTFDETKAYWNIRKSIIENNIFGVDLNRESVEITKLALWILQANKTVPLSDLTNNIKRGNSLIDDKNVTEWAFDWKKEFDFQFDVVVGNPPYVSFQKNFIPKEQVEFYTKNYETVYKIFDLFALFIEKSTNLLTPQGRLNFICPSVLLMNNSFSKTREFLCKRGSLEHIAFLSDGIFEEAVVPTIIFQFVAQKKQKDVKIWDMNKETKKFSIIRTVENSFFCKNPIYGFNIKISQIDLDIITKCENNSILLGEVLEIRETIKTGNDEKFISDKKLSLNYFPLVTGKDVSKYFVQQHRFILFDEKELSRPTKIAYYQQEKIFIRRVGANITAAYDNKNLLSTHVLYIGLSKNTDYLLKYLLFLLNSNLFNYIHKMKFPAKGDVFPEIRIGNLRELPVKEISIDKQNIFVEKVNLLINYYKEFNKSKNDFIEILQSSISIDKISQKLEKWYEIDYKTFVKQLEKAKVDVSPKQHKQWKDFFAEEQPKTLSLALQVEQIETELNNLVYKLYDLTEEEITIIENEK